jgi:hypothetical protein
MIPAGTGCKIREYWMIDHTGTGSSRVCPEEGEIIMGIPHSWYSDNSIPFIEHRKDGKVWKTVNCADVSEIVFDV